MTPEEDAIYDKQVIDHQEKSDADFENELKKAQRNLKEKKQKKAQKKLKEKKVQKKVQTK
jgi:hypothetical protein